MKLPQLTLLALLLPSFVLAKNWSASDSSSAPGKYVGQIIVFFKDGRLGGGSGTLIGKSHVLTAGHVIIDKDKKYAGRPASEWKPVTMMFTPGQKGTSAPFGSANATIWAVSNGLLDGTSISRDYGVMKLNRDLGSKGKTYKTAGGYLPLMKWTTDWSYYVTIYGYPAASNSSQKQLSDDAFNESSWTIWDWDGVWRDWHRFQTKGFHQAIGGTSGGPAIYNRAFVIGVSGQPRGSGIAGFRAGGMRISDIVYNEILAWVGARP